MTSHTIAAAVPISGPGAGFAYGSLRNPGLHVALKTCSPGGSGKADSCQSVPGCMPRVACHFGRLFLVSRYHHAPRCVFAVARGSEETRTSTSRRRKVMGTLRLNGSGRTVVCTVLSTGIHSLRLVSNPPISSDGTRPCYCRRKTMSACALKGPAQHWDLMNSSGL